MEDTTCGLMVYANLVLKEINQDAGVVTAKKMYRTGTMLMGIAQEIGVTNAMRMADTRTGKTDTLTHRMQGRGWKMIIKILNQINMENQYYFKIFYDKICVWSVVAYTKWEAIDRAYYNFIGDRPHLQRDKFKAKKVY